MIFTAVTGPIPSGGAGGLPRHFEWAIVSAIAFSFVVGVIEIDRQVQKTLRCCFVPQSFLYWFLLALGNVVATLLAAVLVQKLDPSLSEAYWLFAAFFGVFAFQGVLKNTNVTISGKGFLTIDDWLKKALTSATAASIAKDTNLNDIETGQLARELAMVPISKLNAFATMHLSSDNQVSVVAQLDAIAAANNADPLLYKGYAIANAVPRSLVRAFLR